MRFNRVSKILQIIPRYHYYWFTAFRDWSRKFAASTNQNSKTETKRVFVNRVFPRFRQSAYFLCEFSLAPCGILLCCDWLLLWVLCFGLTELKNLSQRIVKYEHWFSVTAFRLAKKSCAFFWTSQIQNEHQSLVNDLNHSLFPAF